MATLCPACSKANPANATYCYYDGRNLSQAGLSGPLQVGTLPFPMPFCFSNGQGCANFNQLALACDERWNEAKGLLANGTWPSFFSAIGRIDLAMVALQAAKEPDLDVGLSQLLEKLPADPQAMRPPQLSLPSTEENLGKLTPGTDHRFELMISNRGMLVLRGMVRTDCEWLSFGDRSGPALKMKMFQTRGIYSLPVCVLGHKLRAGGKPLEGEIIIDTNGGAITLPVRAVIPIRPFPGGTDANNALAGAKSPRELALKAKAHPPEAAVLFEQGSVKAWYASNGWNYPIQTTQASGKGAVQQFFEALGLTKPPRLEIDAERLHCQGKAGQRLTLPVTISNQEHRPVYAQAWSNQAWIKAEPGKSQGSKLPISILIEVPPCPGETLHADVTIQGNGQQQFAVPVTLEVLAGRAHGVAGAEEPAGKLPLGWIFAGAGLFGLLFLVMFGVGAFVANRRHVNVEIPPPIVPPIASTHGSANPPTNGATHGSTNGSTKIEAWWDGLPDTKLAEEFKELKELKELTPPQQKLFDDVAATDEAQRGKAYQTLLTEELAKLLGNPKAREPLRRLLAECCVFEPSDWSMAELRKALTSQLPRKDAAFRSEVNGEELERGSWSLQVLSTALIHPGMAVRSDRVRTLTQELKDVFGIAEEKKSAPAELSARTEKLLALRYYRDTKLTASKSLEHAVVMRSRLIKVFPQHLSPPSQVTLDLELIVLGLSQGNDAGPKLEPILKTCPNPDIEMKIADLRNNNEDAAARQMDQLLAAKKMAALIDGLDDPSVPVRRESAHTLAERGPSAKQAAAAVAARLRVETEPEVLAELARALGQIRAVTKEAMDALQAKATHANDAVRFQVIQAQLNLGPEAMPASTLFRLMGDDNRNIGQCAEKALPARFETPTPDDLQGAIDALKDENAKVRRQATRALGLSGRAAKEAAPLLGALLRTETEAAVRAEAARSVGLIRSDSKEILDALSANVKHADAAVRFAVLQSLVALQGERISLRVLFSFAEDGEREINQPAGAALRERLKSVAEADVPDLRQGLKSKSSETQRTVANGLGQLGRAAEAAAGDLVSLLKSGDPLLRLEAAIALAKINPKEEDAVKQAVPILVAAFGLQPNEDETEWAGRCERARNAALTLGKPTARALAVAISRGGPYSGTTEAEFRARVEVYRTLGLLGASAKGEALSIKEAYYREGTLAGQQAAKQALDGVNSGR